MLSGAANKKQGQKTGEGKKSGDLEQIVIKEHIQQTIKSFNNKGTRILRVVSKYTFRPVESC